MAMRLRIGEYEIPEEALTNITLIEGTSTVTFSGMAQESEGMRIVSILKKLESRRTAIKYEAFDELGVRSAGLCNITNLKFEEITTKPHLVIFSGELVSPDSS
jgi:hypothetical protein